MWYYVRDNQRIGPVDEGTMSSLIQNGTVIRQTPVWKDGMQDWAQAAMTELQSQFQSVPPTLPAYAGLTTYAPYPAYYPPGSFQSLWLWFAWLVGAGLPLCLVCIGIVPLIAGVVLSYILLYRFWGVIQDGRARTSPGKAVGFCFIPFFNFYWIYVAIVGLAKDMNVYCDERRLAGPRAGEGLALAWYILSLTSIIPYLGLLISIAVTIIWIVLYKQFTDVAERIAAQKAM